MRIWMMLLAALAKLVRSSDWSMNNRFYGFRFAAKQGVAGLDMLLQAQADQHGCFGWVQRTKKGAWVGEARCSKDRGPILEGWLRQNAGPVDVLVYQDTKIRLHFSHFKILDGDRDTCFLDAPHQCDSLTGTAGSVSSSPGASDEL
jgi:hypothetical protein